MKFYFDGELSWEVTDAKLIPWVKETFILSSGWARDEDWGDGDIEDADLPYYAEVDWFRAYKRARVTEQTDTAKSIFYGLEDLNIPVNGLVDLRAGVYAIDNVDDTKILTEKIIIDDSEIHSNIPGNYTVYYSVTDKAGNETRGKRKINII